MSAGYTQEANGDRSHRRLLAILYAGVSFALFAIAALRNSQWAFWGGVACTVASIVYPILTTTHEIKEVAAAWKGVKSKSPTYEGEK
jgi:hypothetical protein